MVVNIILPLHPLPLKMVQFFSDRVREYFCTDNLAAYSIGTCTANSAEAAGVPVIYPVEELFPTAGDVVVFFAEPDPSGIISRAPFAGPASLRQYSVDLTGRFYPYPRDKLISDVEYPDLDTHIFNRLGPRGGGFVGFYYYPYGYLFRDCSVGPINSLGFRIPRDISYLKDRPPEHKLIVTFGGSAAFSMFSFPSEMFSAVLERNLNKEAKKFPEDIHVSVLNFGMHGNIVINEMTSFLLYCNELKPDIVIAHDGWNDVAYGLMSDSHLLDKWKITYQNNLESWSQLIHGTHNYPVGQPQLPFKQNNLYFSVLRAYMARKNQFKALVESSGALFIWGVQPSIFNKSAPSEQERARTNMGQTDAFSKIYSLTEVILNKLIENLRDLQIEHLVDFPQIFSKFDESVTLFADHVHTVAEGDQIIGDAYAAVVSPLIFGSKQHKAKE